MPNRSRAQEIVAQFLDRIDKDVDPTTVTDETSLWGEGLGLDSLEAAELSTMLEDELGSDPFSTSEVLPETIGDVLAYYGPADEAASV